MSAIKCGVCGKFGTTPYCPSCGHALCTRVKASLLAHLNEYTKKAIADLERSQKHGNEDRVAKKQAIVDRWTAWAELVAKIEDETC